MLKRNAGLVQGDRVILFVDPPSFEALQGFDILGHIQHTSPFPIEFRTIPQPKTLLEGFLHKYRIDTWLETELAVYMDVDVLCVRPICNMLADQFQKADIVAMREGMATLSPYLGDLRPANEISPSLPGLSAGWFAFRNSPRAIAVIARTLQRSIEGPELMQHEQPYWNESVWHFQNSVVIDFLPYSTYETNLASLNSSTALLNLCGEVGNGAFHFERVLTAVLYLSDTQ